MDIKNKITQPEGRRIEFKELLPATLKVAKSIIAFANDAGGEFFVGIKDNPREITGIPESELDKIETQISNLINDLCEPIISPEISYVEVEGKKVIRVLIHKGFKPPYYLKTVGKAEGTYIRVGSTNRQATPEIITELERQGKNISFDGEVVHGMTYDTLDCKAFADLFLERTNEKLSEQALRKLFLVTEQQGKLLPTNALILLSDSPIRNRLFPNAKIECARFKGTVPGTFIDDKTINCNVSGQAEEAYQFVMRHVNKGTVDYQGVFHNERWEYPMKAIREVLRNAVIHRDYSLTGKDIKVAIFDDKIEITSPGKLMPTVDFSLMDAGQSDVRNQVLAPVFKKLGIIEQWGNGLQLIANELSIYPNIQLVWNEPGMAFRVSFKKSVYEIPTESPLVSQQELQQELEQELQQESLYSKSLRIISENTSATKDIAVVLGQKSISNQLYTVINKLREQGLIEWTIPEIPKSSKQQYKITRKGISFLKLLQDKTK